MLIDLFTPTAANGRGQLSVWNSAGEVFTLLLHKALAKWHGSYTALAVVPTRQLVLEITGLAIDDVSLPNSKGQEEASQVRQLVPALCDNKHCIPMVSFHRVDGHHCAFRVLSATEICIEILDTNRILAYGMNTLGIHQHEHSEGRSSALQIPWTQFFAMEPQVFQIRADRRHQQRLRRVMYPTNQGVDYSFTTRAVLSVAVSTSISLTVSRSRLHCDSVDNEYVLKVSVDRVDDHDLALRYPWTTRPSPTSSASWHSLSFPASSGEYIISVEISRTKQPQCTEERVQHCNATRSLRDNIDLLFACLDDDGDGLLGRREISHFLCRREPELAPDDDAVDNFLMNFGSFDKSNKDSAFALTRDDLLHVYQSMAARLDNVNELVQRDLCRMLALDGEGATTFRDDELLDVVLVLSSASKGCELVTIE
ncbi:hypothetical protein PINS_up015485 [Pythium insidiosum]|nr:hypothetical protein PINS_up015485 [Pythium insidiosum]